MIALAFITFLRGLAFCLPAIILGILIARYVPPQAIGIGTMLLSVIVLYMAGSVLRPINEWKFRKKKP